MKTPAGEKKGSWKIRLIMNTVQTDFIYWVSKEQFPLKTYLELQDIDLTTSVVPQSP